MVIVELVPTLSSGGAEKLVVDLCNELSFLHEIHLIVFKCERENSFRVSDISPRVTIHSLNRPMSIRNIATLKVVIRSLRIINPDIIHTHLLPYSWIFLLGLLFRNAKCIHTIHNLPKKEVLGLVNQFFFFGAARLKLCFYVAIAEKAYEELLSMIGERRSFLIKNGIYVNFFTLNPNLSKLRKDENTRILVAIGRIEKSKNFLMLASAVNNLIDLGYKLKLVIVGREHDSFQSNLIRSMNSPHIHLVGEQKFPLNYLCQADALCMTSLYEGMPLVLIEAFALGIIPICTPAGGIVNMVLNGENGILSKDYSEESYIKALMQFLTISEDKREQMKKNAFASFSQYDIKICAEEYEKIFLKLK